jgi:hypothetical protein
MVLLDGLVEETFFYTKETLICALEVLDSKYLSQLMYLLVRHLSHVMFIFFSWCARRYFYHPCFFVKQYVKLFYIRKLKVFGSDLYSIANSKFARP